VSPSSATESSDSANPLCRMGMAVHLRFSSERGSAPWNPEKLHGRARLMVSMFLCAVVMLILLGVDVASTDDFLKPTLPTGSGPSEAEY
jgi:hypothetical protein